MEPTDGTSKTFPHTLAVKGVVTQNCQDPSCAIICREGVRVRMGRDADGGVLTCAKRLKGSAIILGRN